MRSVLCAIGATMLLAGCGGGKSEPTAANAWIRLPAVAGRPGAAYLRIEGGTKPTTLNSIRVPAARLVELHESMDHHGTASMQAIERLDIPAGTTVELKPGGKHAMLFDLDPALRAGDTTKVTLLFSSAPPIELDARLVGAGEAAPE